jgi:hypothetical protein
MNDQMNQDDQTYSDVMDVDMDPDAPLSPAMELNMLKERAKTIGLRFAPKIGLDALRAKVTAALNGEAAKEDEEVAEAVAAPKKPKLTAAEAHAKMRSDMQKDQMRLIRLRIMNLNPSKKDLQGEIFTVANKILGTVRKFIPYGEVTDAGYHVPFILYQQMKDREFLQVKSSQNSKGEQNITQRWAKEFALEVLDPLKPADIAKLANSQAAAAGMN